MKSVSIRELHNRTGEVVRASASEKILVTERGKAVALLKGVQPADLAGKHFPKRDRRRMPKVKIDSTIYVSADRDGR